MNTRLERAAVTAMVLWSAAACVNADTTAPAAPRFDGAGTGDVISRLPQITLSGSAEYGAQLTLASDKAFGGGTAPAAQTADPYTGRFSYPNVGLAKGKNTFTLTATDDAGNKSPAATLVVDWVDEPSALEVSVSTPVVQAGSGAVTVTARVLAPVDGFKLDGRTVTFALSGAKADPQDATTDAHGRASATFQNLTEVGVITATATVKDDPALSDSASFAVVAGDAATLSLALAPANGAASTSVTVPAGSDVSATVTVKDGSQNPVDAPVQLFTDAPGALVAGLTLTNLHVAGTFHVVAAVAGAPTQGGMAVSAAATLTVTAGVFAKVTLSAPSTANAGEPFAYSFALTDGFGNPVDPPASATVVLSSTTDSNFTVDGAAQHATFTKAGPQNLTATVSGTTPPVTASQTVTVSPAAPAAVTVTLSGTDANPATPDLEVNADSANAVTVTTAVSDRFQNPVMAAVAVTTDAPGIFDGSAVRGVTKAGAYTVTATVANTSIAARKGFTVLPMRTQNVLLDLAAAQVVAGTAVPFNARAVDAFGNVTGDAVALSLDGLSAGVDYAEDDAAKTLTVNKAGSQTVRAKLATGGTATASAALLVVPGAPAVVTIDSGTATTVAAGTNVPFAVTASDALGNVIANPPVTQAVLPTGGTLVDAPGPVVSGGRIYNLVRPGTYQLVAQVIGTSLTNDTSLANANLTVTAADAASVALVLSRAVADVGSPVSFSLVVKDAFGNLVPGANPTVQVKQGTTVVAPLVDGTSWTATASGSYQLVASLTVNSKTLTDTESLTITDPPDTTGPTITFANPSGDPTISAWPAPGATSPASCPGAGDVLSVTAADPSLVSQVWLSAGGAANAFSTPPSLTFPLASATFSQDVCTSGAGAPTRGEVLATFAAADLKGNYRQQTAGWCVDADATGYVPANPPANRCVVLKADATAPNVFALAANDAGDLVLGREAANGDAFVQKFKRSATYGLGTAHAITGFQSTRGVAMVSSTAFASVISTSKMAVNRTTNLTSAGAGTDDLFVSVDSTTDRFEGVVAGMDGSLYVTSGARPGTGGAITSFSSKLWKFDRPLDTATKYTALPTTPVASSSTVHFTNLCRSTRSTELYATGYTQASGKTVPTVVRITLASGNVATVWTGSDSTQLIGGCAVTNAGIAVALSKGTAATGLVTLIDPAAGTLAANPLMSGYSASAAFDRTFGIAAAQGYLFASSSETAGSSLIRFARTGGF